MTEREDYLRAYIPAELQQKLQEAGGRIQGERRTVTVLFADTVGSTALGQALDPETYQSLMSQILGAMVESVVEFEGMVARLQGDGLLAFFGAPLAHEDDAERAVRAGLSLLARIKSLSGEIEEAYGVALQARVGVNTGPVIAGEVGSLLRMEYTAIGDTVNLASRLEGLAEPGTLLASEATWRLVAALFEGQPLEPQPVKGLPEPVPTIRVSRARDVSGKVRGIAGLESPLVGREEELRRLEAAVEGLKSGIGHLTAIVGEPGIGKSRLVAELRQRAPDLEWLEGRCLSYGESVAYLPFADLLRDWLGASASDPPIKVRTELQTRVRRLFGPRFDEIYPYLAWLLGLPLEPELRSRLTEMAPESLKRRLFDVLITLVTRLADSRPLVLVFDDLHWADPISLELLDEVMDATEYVPLMVLLLLRPERQKGCWSLYLHAQTDHANTSTLVTLDPLSSGEARELIGALLREADLPSSLIDLIVRKAEGNPFFLEELVRSLIDARLLQPTDGGWRAAAMPERIEVPDTVEGVIKARIDRLPAAPRQVLQAASVIGRIFSLPVLQAVTSLDGALEGMLSELQRLDLVLERRRIPVREYGFRHALVQEVAYHGLLDSVRREMHLAAARALEAQHGEAADEVAGLLGYHFGEAGEVDKAVRYLTLAGDRARAAFAHEEALAHYRRLLELQQGRGEVAGAFATRLKMALVHHGRFDFAGAARAYAEAFASQPREQASSSVPDRELRFGYTMEPETLDPGLVLDPWAGWIVEQLFEGLVTLTSDASVVPAAARAWSVSEDGTRYLFELDPGRRWSDGRPVTAHDFVYAWRRLFAPGNPNPVSGGLANVLHAEKVRAGQAAPEELGATALDDQRLEVRLSAPAPYFLEALTNAVAYPVPAWAIEAHGEGWIRPGRIVTNGPYLLESWQEGPITLVANPEYSGAFPGNVKRLVLYYPTFPGQTRAFLPTYDRGELDLVLLPFGEGLVGVGRDDLLSVPVLNTWYVGIHTERAPFDQLALRRAIAAALDRGAVVRGTPFTPANGGFLPPALPGHTAHIGQPHDPELARALLREAGHPGRPIVLATVSSVLREATVRIIVEELRSVLGLELEVRVASWFEELHEWVGRAEVDLWLSGWLADYPDPDNFLRVGLGQEMLPMASGWDHKRYWDLVEAASRARDVEERLRLYREADRLLVEQVALVPMGHGRSTFLVKPYVRGFAPSAFRWPSLREVVIEAMPEQGGG